MFDLLLSRAVSNHVVVTAKYPHPNETSAGKDDDQRDGVVRLIRG